MYAKGERIGGGLKEYFAEIFLLILNCFLWGISGLKRICCRIITDPAWCSGQKNNFYYSLINKVKGN